MTFWSDPTKFVPKQQHRWVVSFSQKDYKPADPADGKNYLFKEFVKSVDKPSFEIKSVQAKYLYSHVFNFPTRPVWKPITITFYDVLVESLIEKKIKYFNKPYLEGNEIKDKESDSGDPHLSTQAFFYKFLQDAGYFNPEELEKPDSLVRLRKYNFKKNMIDALVGNPGGVSNSDYYYISGEKKFTNTLLWDTLKIQELDSKGKITEEWNLYNPLITDVKFDKLDYNSENVITISVTIVYDWAELKGYVKDSLLDIINASPDGEAVRNPNVRGRTDFVRGVDSENLTNIKAAVSLPSRSQLPEVDLSSPTEGLGASRGQAIDAAAASRALNPNFRFSKESEPTGRIDASFATQGINKTPTTSAEVLQSYFNSNPSYNEAVQNRQQIFESKSTNKAAASRRAETRLASDLQAQQNNSPRRAVSSSPPDPASGIPARGATLPKAD